MTSLDKDASHDAVTSVVKQIAVLVAWIGTTIAGITAVLTASGYVVEYSYLATLGIVRSVFPVRPSELVFVGGNFFAVLPVAVLLGAVIFLLYCWWMLIAFGIVVVVVRFLKLKVAAAILVAAIVYGIWLTLLLLQLAGRIVIVTVTDAELFHLFAFTVVSALLTLLAFNRASRGGGSPSYGIARLPLAWLVAVSLLLLPYVRGTYAIDRPRPILQPLGETAKYLRGLHECTEWRLIGMGEATAILNCGNAPSVVLVPAKKLEAFALRAEGKSK